MTITHFLHEFNPRFLELDLKWIDALLEVEWDVKSLNGLNSLMYLLKSKKLSNFNFDCRRF